MKRLAARLHGKNQHAATVATGVTGGLMDPQDRLITMIDEALERFGSRDLVSGAEVLDFLLDLRLSLLQPDPFEQLLEEERQPTG